MIPAPKPKTGTLNGRLWGAQADDWANIQESVCRPVYEAVFDHCRITPSLAYLDAGCGAGLAAQMAAARGARVSGVDAAENLLAVARARTPQADFRLGDLEDLPFPDHAFDLITGFNSFQYAGNPVKALSEAKRVAKPGATVAIVTWGKPEGMQAAALIAALKPLLPPPPPGAPGPFALSEEDALRDFARQAGLTPGELLDVPCPWRYPDEATAVRGLSSSGVSVRAAEHSGAEAVTQAHRNALTAFLQPDGSYTIEAAFRCLFARA